MLPVAFIILVVLLALSVPIGAVLGALALALAELYSTMPLHRVMGQVYWQNNNDFLIVAVPLFILMGELMLHAGIARRMYGAAAQWLSWLPGGLMHSNIGSCAIFAATSGSSVATAATIGTVALPEISRHRYNERLFLGSVAVGGSLGILIPPSINLIIYALLTNTSVPDLYLAGFIPGLLLAGLFMIGVLVCCIIRPAWGGIKVETSWGERIRELRYLLAPLLLFFLVVGSIYAGLATPTEAAALGVLGVLGISSANRTLSIKMLRTAIEGTVRTTGMVTLIVFTAMYLNFVLAAIGLTDQLTNFVLGLGLGPTSTMLMIIAFYLVLGCFMESFSMMLTTTPLIAPIVVSLGYDPIWFGIMLMVLMETAQITPPIGINLFIIQSLREPGKPIHDVMLGALPFVGVLLVMIGLLMLFPALATWLPQQFR